MFSHFWNILLVERDKKLATAFDVSFLNLLGFKWIPNSNQTKVLLASFEWYLLINDNSKIHEKRIWWGFKYWLPRLGRITKNNLKFMLYSILHIIGRYLVVQTIICCPLRLSGLKDMNIDKKSMWNIFEISVKYS